MTHNDRISFFRDLISCINPLFSWTYTDSGDLVYSNTGELEESRLFQKVFKMANVWAAVQSHFENDAKPVVVSINSGLIWAAAQEKDEDGRLIHVLGPAFGAETSLEEVKRALRPWEGRMAENREDIRRYLDIVKKIPVVSYLEMSNYAIMLHYCLTGEKLALSDIILQRSSAVPENALRPLAPEDRHRQWMAEESLLRMVTEGNMNYRDVLNRSLSIKNLWVESSGTALEKEMLNQIAFTVLSARAAVAGGLSADTAFHLGNAYIKSLQTGKTISAVRATGLSMYEDFINRVHNNRTNQPGSALVKQCREYISLHAEEELRIETIARRMGYTTYYLARKYRAESGESLMDAIRNAKLERSKFYLVTTEKSIREISEILCFSSRTRYSDAFSNYTGVSPMQYRKEHQPL